MIRFSPEARKQFDDLPRVIQGRMDRLVERLKQWPNVSGAKPLSGNLAGHYRMRTGDFRLQFTLMGQDIWIEQVGHRDGFYD